MAPREQVAIHLGVAPAPTAVLTSNLNVGGNFNLVGSSSNNGVYHPVGGCTLLNSGTNMAVSGATDNYLCNPTNNYQISVSATAERKSYAMFICTNLTCTFTSGISLWGSWTVTGSNIVSIQPSTGTTWIARGLGVQ